MIGIGLSRLLRIPIAHTRIWDRWRGLQDERVTDLVASMRRIHPTKLILLAVLIVLQALMKKRPADYQPANTLAVLCTPAVRAQDADRCLRGAAQHQMMEDA